MSEDTEEKVKDHNLRCEALWTVKGLCAPVDFTQLYKATDAIIAESTKLYNFLKGVSNNG